MTDEEAARLIAHYAELLSGQYEGKRTVHGLLTDALAIASKADKTKIEG